jgi:hypothetical protein
MNATDKYKYAEFPNHRTIENKKATGTIFRMYTSFVMFTPSTTFNTLTKMKAKAEHSVIWIMVSATGKGNPKPFRIHLLYKMTHADTVIQSNV